MMEDDTVESITVNQRVNGWWVTVRLTSGHEEHHGPYADEETAQTEADVLSVENRGLAEERKQ